MTVFNPDPFPNPTANINVEQNDDEVKIRFTEETLTFNSTTDGLSLTNDWNNRHFTLSFKENSVLYHITREDIDDRQAGKRAIAPEEFIAEIYGYIRAFGKPVLKDNVEFEIVGKVDIEKVRGYLEDHGVINDTESGLEVDGEKRVELISKLNEDRSVFGEFFERVLDPVRFEDVKDGESGENIYVYPYYNQVFVLFVLPDDFVKVASIHEVINFATQAGGSQIMDHVLRALSNE